MTCLGRRRRRLRGGGDASRSPVSPPDPAAAYDAWYQTPLGAAAHRIELALVAGAAVPRPGERALDVGCGTGIYTAWLEQLSLEVTGLDRDPAMLGIARTKAQGARLLQGDVRHLPFDDGQFDVVLAVTVFCFLNGPGRALAARELIRVTRPGGRVVIAELAPYNLWAAQCRLRGWRGSRTWSAAHISTASQLRGLLEAAGASPTYAHYGLYLPPLRRLVGWAAVIERAAGRLGPVGAAFVVVRAER